MAEHVTSEMLSIFDLLLCPHSLIQVRFIEAAGPERTLRNPPMVPLESSSSVQSDKAWNPTRISVPPGGQTFTTESGTVGEQVSTTRKPGWTWWFWRTRLHLRPSLRPFRVFLHNGSTCCSRLISAYPLSSGDMTRSRGSFVTPWQHILKVNTPPLLLNPAFTSKRPGSTSCSSRIDKKKGEKTSKWGGKYWLPEKF